MWLGLKEVHYCECIGRCVIASALVGISDAEVGVRM